MDTLKRLCGRPGAGLAGLLLWVSFVMSAGTVLAADAGADNPLSSAYRQQLGPVGWIILALLTLAVGIATLLMLNRRLRDKLALREAEKNPVIDSQRDFVRALIRRDPQVLEPLESGIYGDLPPEIETLAEVLRQPAGALTIEIGSERIIQVSPKPETGQRRVVPGEKFCLADENPEIAPELADLCVSCQADRFILHFGPGQAAARLRLANPAFAFQLRPNSGQAVLLCPGDRLLDEFEGVLVRFDPVPRRRAGE